MPGIAAVLLAAGESTRMGEPKALLPWRGVPLIAHQAQALHDAGYGPIIVVLGHQGALLRAVLPKLPSLVVVENRRYLQGRSTSVVHGLKEAPPDAAGVLTLNVDQPRPATLLRRLRETFEESLPPLAVVAYNGKSGHPILFSAALIPELLAITEKRQGIREVVSRHHDSRLLVEVGTPLALIDLNTWADYEEALKLRDGPASDSPPPNGPPNGPPPSEGPP